MVYKFTKQVCTRCGGTGSYSYNQISGSVCFGCDGKREMLTPIARKAALWLSEQAKAKFCELELGMRVRDFTGKYTIKNIYWDRFSAGKSLQRDGSWIENPPFIHIHGDKLGMAAMPDHTIEVIPTADVLAARIQQILTMFPGALEEKAP